MARWIWIVLLLGFSGVAQAQQVKFDVDKNAAEWRFNVVWKDATGKKQRTRFTLPAEKIKEDLDEPIYLGSRRLQKAKARAINKHDFGRGVEVTARVTDKGTLWVDIDARTKEKYQAAQEELAEVKEDATTRWLKKHGFVEEGRVIRVDWARHVRDYAPDLAPVVEALGGPTEDPRTFATKALNFVQSIPYEHRGKKPDKYRRPLSILGRNRGDCDSKAVLYLALLHQAYPDMELAAVDIRKHVFGAIGIDPEPGEKKFRSEGRVWLAVEPVGPAVVPLGRIGPRSRAALRLRRFDLIVVEE